MYGLKDGRVRPVAKTPARSVRSIAKQNHCENLVKCYNLIVLYESLSKFLSVSYLMKTADVIMNFFSSHNTTDHT